MRLSPRRLKERLAPPLGPQRLPAGVGRGLRLHLDFSQHAGLYLGLYEIELNRYLRRLCRPGVASFDVGGSFGYDALVLARLTGADVVTFEADPDAARNLRANLALNPSEAVRVQVHEGFVGSRPPQMLLDDAIERFFVPRFVKIDVDGAELEVLRGAARLLAEHRPPLIVETHALELERDCGRLLADAGYRVRVVHQRRLLRDYRPIAHNRWLVATPN